MRLITRSSFFAASALGALAVAVSAQAGGPADKVMLCHGTASATNPYVLISVNANALQGHFDGTAPGHGWRNAPDFILPAGYATCEDTLGGGGGDDDGEGGWGGD
jgi:hypothetical protein